MICRVANTGLKDSRGRGLARVFARPQTVHGDGKACGFSAKSSGVPRTQQ